MSLATGIAIGYALSAPAPTGPMPEAVLWVYCAVLAVCAAIIIWVCWETYKDTK